jgi:hypothetical protein
VEADFAGGVAMRACSQVLELRYGGQRARLQRVQALVEAYLLGEVRRVGTHTPALVLTPSLSHPPARHD